MIENFIERKPNTSKILLMGLANSGKTSILLCLQGIRNLAAFNQLRPTKRLKIIPFDLLGTSFSVWDFGGQEALRELHIKEFLDNAPRAKKLFYAIDIQDPKLFNITLEYLDKIVDLMKTNEEELGLKNIEISIFFHKWDPDLELLKVQLDEVAINNLQKKINSIFSDKGYSYSIYKTSIYTVFQKLDWLSSGKEKE